MSGPENSSVKPGQFLRWWISQNIGAGTQLSDAAVLANSLIEDGSQVNFDEAALERAAGKPLKQAIEGAIKRAIEEGLL